MCAMFARTVAAMLPVIPVPIVRAVSRRYIAGETLDQAVTKVRELNARGYVATLDLLGEDVTSEADARRMTDGYVTMLDRITREGLSCNVSLKPTNHGLMVSPELCRLNLSRIVDAADRNGNFVRIDMESSAYTQVTLDLYRDLLTKHSNVGVVLQAYLQRTEADARALVELADKHPVNVRLCKGIYREPRSIAFKKKLRIRENYLTVARLLLQGGVYVGLATHDRLLLAQMERWLDERGFPTNGYEFQALLGVPVTDVLNRYVQEGRKVRLYVPFGENWYGYSTRRLRENPQMAGHVVKAMFRRTRYDWSNSTPPDETAPGPPSHKR
jgi:proline dehydrogenase